METQHGNEAREKIWKMIKDIKVTLMATQDAEGELHSRPMISTQEDFDGTLWFFTRADSRKVQEIEQNAAVLLNYANPASNTYVAITGTAEVVTDPSLIQDMWCEAMRTWFPDGKDDPNIALVRVSAETAEYWDTPSGTLVYAYGYVKALLTGESPHPGDVGRVAIQGAA